MAHPQTTSSDKMSKSFRAVVDASATTNLQFIDLTLPTPEQNLAFDEALLDACEEGFGGEVLRFWEPDQYFVVLGYSGKVRTEAHVGACKKEGVPILRRVSGGGTVLEGPGCLNFSLVLRTNGSLPLGNLSETNTYILGRHQSALAPLVKVPIAVQGISDLTAEGLKFSGNAQRRKRHVLLFHGTFLTGFDFKRVSLFLPLPKKQPAYRKNRPHEHFLTNIDVSPARIKTVLRKKWNATKAYPLDLTEHAEELVSKRYGTRAWNYKFE